jgi:ribosomal protein S15P/S13E
LVEITEAGRATVEEATIALNREVFGDVGMTESQSAALVKSINAVRKHSGDI